MRKNIYLFFAILLFSQLGLCEQKFHAIQTGRPGVTMNIALMDIPGNSKTALLVIPGSDGADGRVMVWSAYSLSTGSLQYLYANNDIFRNAGITLVATGCPSDQTEKMGQCADDYRKSAQYAEDFQKIIDLLKNKYGFEKIFVFGHSSGGISTRWLAVNIADQLDGVINSSAMNRTAGALASSMLNFDMSKIKIPVLNIAHQDDLCPSTPYWIVKNYSHDNLVTVRGGGTSGFVCGGANRHSFEGRQRGVSRAIAKWITTQEVQWVVDTDD